MDNSEVVVQVSDVRLVRCLVGDWSFYAVEAGGGPWMMIGAADPLEGGMALFMETLARWVQQ